MFVIGLTGGTGSGKSEVAKVLQKGGAIIISGDRIGKEVVEKNPQVLKMLVKTFGREILNQKGRLNRRKLGEIVFSSVKNQKKLNQIVHPPLLKELRARIKRFRKKNDSGRFAVVDAALITEWNLEKELDATVAVTSGSKLRLRRLLKQGLSPKEIRNRIARQLNDKKRVKRADFVFKNNGSLAALRKRAINLYHIIKALIILGRMEKLVAGFDTKV